MEVLMKDNKNISTAELNLIAEELESLDRQMKFLDLTNPVEGQLHESLQHRIKLIAQAFQGNTAAYKELKRSKVSGFYQ